MFVLPDVPGDVLAVTELLRDHFDMKVKQHLVGHGPRWEQMDKRKVVGILGNLFKCDASTLFIYVAGHGEGDEDSEDPMLGKGGNWIIDNYNNPNDKKYKTISLREIMTLWLAAKKKRTDSPKLVITMDVCFAGTVSSLSPTPSIMHWVAASASFDHFQRASSPGLRLRTRPRALSAARS